MRMRQDFLAYLYMSVKNNALVRFQICLYFAAVNYMKVTADPPFIVAEGPLVSPCSPSLPQHNLVFMINSVRYRGILRRDTIPPYVYTPEYEYQCPMILVSRYTKNIINIDIDISRKISHDPFAKNLQTRYRTHKF